MILISYKHLAASCILILFAQVATAQVPCGGYEVTAIVSMEKCPPFGIPPVVPLGINEQGWMVGYFNPCVIGANRAWLWTPEDGLVVIPTPAGTSYSRAVAISGSLIVGEYDNTELELGRTGFLYNYETDEFTSLGTLRGGNWSQAKDINSAGQIAGFWGNNLIGPWHTFLWENGKMMDLGPSIGGTDNRALGINENGVITGWWLQIENGDRIAFLWEDGKVTSLGAIPGGFTSKGNRINIDSQIAVSGSFNDDHPLGFISGGFLWKAGKWIDLGMLEGYDSMALKGLNDDGTIVGWSRDIQNGQHPDTAFVWSDGEMTELDDLLPPESQLHIKRAEAINESGQIAVQAVNADNDTVAVLLTPIKGALGDLDGDCQVSTVDILLMFSNWGPCDSCESCPADLDKNCAVGVSDLLILFSNWG